jgi:hypothetical protein
VTRKNDLLKLSFTRHGLRFTVDGLSEACGGAAFLYNLPP